MNSVTPTCSRSRNGQPTACSTAAGAYEPQPVRLSRHGGHVYVTPR